MVNSLLFLFFILQKFSLLDVFICMHSKLLFWHVFFLSSLQLAEARPVLLFLVSLILLA